MALSFIEASLLIALFQMGATLRLAVENVKGEPRARFFHRAPRRSEDVWAWVIGGGLIS
jgi:hypothetical protein